MPRSSARRELLVRGLLSLGVLAASAFILLTSQPRLGLDLRGGTQIVLQTPAEATSDNTDRAMEVLRRRIDELGVAEPVLARSGDHRIIVELPGVQDPAEAIDVLGRTAQLAVQPVTGPGDTPTGEAGDSVALGPIAMTGEGIKGAVASPNQQGAGWQVTVDFQGDAPSTWQKVTGEAACFAPGDPQRRVAFVLDGKVVSAPQVDPSVPCRTGMIGTSTQITGKFAKAEAEELALVIRSGALPVPVEVVEQRTVGPTLGAEAIEASSRAAVVGIALTGLFLIFVYRLAGLVAVLALVGYAGMSYAALLAVGATLTLPGLAGFVLAIGMAVDANVLVFERSREEYARRKRLPRSVDQGFKGAFSAVADSNVTTLLAAGLLFFLATGPVKGFGVTLSIGVLASLFSALVLTRVLLQLAMPLLERRPTWSGLHDLGRVRTWLTSRGIRLFQRPKRWLVTAAAVLLVALAGLFVRGLDLGVEFTGGRMIDYTASAVDAGEVRAELSAAGFADAVVATSGDTGVSVRTGPIDEAAAARVTEAVNKATGGAQQVSNELIGPSLGSELRRNAIIALAIAVAAQLAYLAVRFDWRLGLATVVALVTDVVVLVGAFAWLGKTADGVFLAALLTVIGYSVNDSVVVFDRVRELRKARRKDPYADVVGAAVLQTVPRTVNTGIGVLFVLAALLVLGDGSLADFATALLVGVVAGTVSTVLTAAPVAIALDGRAGGRR
ncbi:protein translocase subunit SecD [Actinosynnema sp. NPDC047251]|uniref:Multifunctional fusion protein n=1 Tax=Saccharothrix espanaensis (strain ATCC 51144 / DSM 44229 / JCM 9112 / NBRC 15066 / NRRL 15764) TaxID=1179773 RepID=K0JWR1_SACES|nr:protein translocase subunit SecD [Saccharothrix espanaensis]CCH28593.1 Bifunctional preprotein translocase subunit SecD/SecF [Saccharothrix espanaensis DSM 44229]